MNESLTLLLTFGAGGLLGTLFFAGLWWTARKKLGSRQAAIWFLASFLVRNGITLTGFYLVGRDRWERMIVCLVGFWTARLIVIWLTRPSSGNPALGAPEVRHAP